MGRGKIPEDPELAEDIYDTFQFITAPETMNPESWFWKMPGEWRDLRRVGCVVWHTERLKLTMMNVPK